MLVEACVFNLGQIGELANKVDSDFAKSHSVNTVEGAIWFAKPDNS